MFCDKRKVVHTEVDFSEEKDLVNRQFKYRTLGEIVAMAKATGVAPLPTRNGVYTGEEVIPRDDFEKIAIRRKLMSSLESSEAELNKILADEALAAEERKSAEIAKKAVEDYKSTLRPAPVAE